MAYIYYVHLYMLLLFFIYVYHNRIFAYISEKSVA